MGQEVETEKKPERFKEWKFLDLPLQALEEEGKKSQGMWVASRIGEQSSVDSQ